MSAANETPLLGEIILGAIDANLSAKSLVITLNWKLAKAMDLKSSMRLAPLTLGMRTTRLEFRLGNNHPWEKNYATDLQTSSPAMSQKNW